MIVKKFLLPCAILALSLLPISAEAELNATSMFYSLQNTNDPHSLFWAGVVAGAWGAYAGQKGNCQTPATNIGQEVQIVVNYMKANPKIWSLSPSEIVWAAMYDTYPCAKTK